MVLRWCEFVVVGEIQDIINAEMFVVCMRDETVRYLEQLQRVGIKPGLKRIEQLIGILDHPQDHYPIIHVAGTNGKGSTCAMMASILQASGKKVGLHTSPHLISICERFRINDNDISEEEFERYVGIIRKKVEDAGLEPSYFEFMVGLAFYYFADQNVDIAIIETGLGGKYDATNVVVPKVSVITTVGLDHTEYLGDTLKAIAEEKAGIIKRRTKVVCGSTRVKDLIGNIALEKECSFFPVHDFLSASVDEETLDGQTFTVEGSFQGTFFMPLLGRHQVNNALCAIGALLQLEDERISEEAFVEGFKKIIWKGRMQVMQKDPLILVDGAHNEDGMWKLGVFIDAFEKKDVLILALSRGKGLDVAHDVVKQFDRVIVTEGMFREEESSVLFEDLVRRGIQAENIPDVDTAIARGLEIQEDGLLLVTGSLYMIGEAMRCIKEGLNDEKRGHEKKVSTTAP